MAYKSSPRDTRRVRLIVVHTAEGARTADSLAAYFSRDDVQASSHVGIDDTKVVQFVPYDRMAWTVRSGNAVSENAELCGFASWTRAEWLANHRGMLDLTADWIRSRCTARGIPLVRLSPADVAAGKAGVIGHVDWTEGMRDGTHTDPGVGFPWDYVMARASGTAITTATSTTKDTDDVSWTDDIAAPFLDPAGKKLIFPAKDWLSYANKYAADAARDAAALRQQVTDLTTAVTALTAKVDALASKLAA